MDSPEAQVPSNPASARFKALALNISAMMAGITKASFMSGSGHPIQRSASPESRCKRQRVTPSTEPDEVTAQHSNGPLGEIPLEILTEIFKHLEPASLLKLLRTSKLLRALLLNRPVASAIWKSALSSMHPAPPPCPDDLTLPQYATLLYGNCHFCDTAENLQYAWVCYLRVCDDCLSVRSRNFIEIRTDRPGLMTLYQMVPSYTKPREYLHDDDDEHILCQPAEYEQKGKELRKMARGNKKRYEEWVSQEQGKLTRRREKCKVLSLWEESVDIFTAATITAKREARTEEILERLIKEEPGYEAIVNRRKTRTAQLVQTVPGVNGLDPLTEEDWKSVRPLLVNTIESLKLTFEQEDRARLIAKRIADFRPLYDHYISHNRNIQTPAPWIRQVAEMGPFKSLIYDTPADQKLTKGDFLAHLDAMPHIIESWKEDVAGVLLGLVLESEKTRIVTTDGASTKGKEREKVPDKSILYRATSIFVCQRCSAPMVYPFVYTHRCRTGRFRLRYGNRTMYTLDKDDQVGVHNQASRCARSVVGALGQDPDTVTWEQLERDNQRVECVRCRTKVRPQSRNKYNRLVMNWRHAISHEIETHSKEGEDSCETGWLAVEAQSLATVYSKESELFGGPVPILRFCVECKLCSIQDNEVVYPPGWSSIDSTLSEDAETCLAGHDLSMGVFTPSFPPIAYFRSEPYPVTISEVKSG
ncbi:hypothetical protein EST38_g4572 [Candolleomyces aberdarensis]|uniref:F-box domain-containing protein n=1 Tax=Candolleomyces aberdarensis TaxID=2316362 RepID=A0A4Q2DMU3_9AGAR|nr:hypothetical protein EST38_g4572 [Candolleomyces aberdarensis]